MGRAALPGQPPGGGSRVRRARLGFGELGHHDRCKTHAKQRAITLAREGDGWRKLPGSHLIYVRLEADGSVRLADPHFGARCSLLALSLGVAQRIFALSEGVVGYSSADYDTVAALRWPRRPPGGILAGVAATSASRAWAVGGTESGSGTGEVITTLIAQWNGTGWARVPSPSPAGGAALSGVAAVSASSAFAVGDVGATKTLIERWNGTAWKVS